MRQKNRETKINQATHNGGGPYIKQNWVGVLLGQYKMLYTKIH